MTGPSSNRVIKESSEALYVTSSYLSETAYVWGQPQIIMPETMGQVTKGVYVHMSAGSGITIEDDAELWNEIKMWEEANISDLILFEKRIEDE